MGYGPMSGLGGIGARIGGSGIGQFFKGMGPKLFGSATAGARAAGMPSFLGETGFAGTKGILGKLGLTGGFGKKMLTPLGMISSASLLGYFVQKGATEEEAKELAQDVYRGKGLGLDQIRADMQKYQSGALSASQAYDKGYHFLTPQTYLGAQGGRVGFVNGTIAPMPVLTDKDSIRKRLYDPSRGEYVSKTAASEDAPFHQQRVLLDDLDQSGGVVSIFGGPSELEEAEYESGKLDDQYQRSEIRLALAKQIKEENPDWSTKEVWNEINKITKELYPHLFNKGGNVGMKKGGIANVLPKGKEADYRGGGVIPIGSRERADDVPARLSKNEFVMTADAVRAAGGGNINQGAKRMYNLMNNLEARV